MKKIIVLIFLSFEGLSQSILPSFHGTHNASKIPANGQVSLFNFSSGESGYTLNGVTSTTDKNGNANGAVEIDDLRTNVISSDDWSKFKTFKRKNKL